MTSSPGPMPRAPNEASKALGQLKTDHGVRRVQLEEEDARRARVQRDQQDLSGQIEQESQRLVQARTALAEAESKRETHQSEREQLQGALSALSSSEQAAVQAALPASEGWDTLISPVSVKSNYDPDDLAPFARPGDLPKSAKLDFMLHGSNYITRRRAWDTGGAG